MSMQDQNVLNELFESSPFCWTFSDNVQFCSMKNVQKSQEWSNNVQACPVLSKTVKRLVHVFK